MQQQPDIAIANAQNQGLAPCPHCAASARVIADDRFRWVCGTCGAPRVNVDDPSVHSEAEYAHLRRARDLVTKARLIRGGATFTALGATGFGFLGLLTATAVHVGVVLPLLLLGASVAFAIMTIAFGANARKKIDDAKAAVSSAWETVAEALMRKHRRSVTALDLAAMMKVDESEAERILTLLSVDDRVRGEVTSEAQVRYSVPGQLRVDVDNPLSNQADIATLREIESEQQQRATAQTVMVPVPKIENK